MTMAGCSRSDAAAQATTQVSWPARWLDQTGIAVAPMSTPVAVDIASPVDAAISSDALRTVRTRWRAAARRDVGERRRRARRRLRRASRHPRTWGYRARLRSMFRE